MQTMKTISIVLAMAAAAAVVPSCDRAVPPNEARKVKEPVRPDEARKVKEPVRPDEARKVKEPVRPDEARKVKEPVRPDEARKGVTAVSNPVVIVTTSEGVIKIELWKDKAPVTVANFLRYTDEKFYDGTIFHRVMRGFMIQGGGFTPDMKQKAGHDPIKNEASASLSNKKGTIAMARTNVVDSATAQFFINHVDNAALDHRDNTARGFGYAVFGKVTDGMDVVEKIAAVATGRSGGHSDVPIKPIVIESVRLAE